MGKADNLSPSCAVATKSENLNFLEPSGPLRACNGTALPLPLEANTNHSSAELPSVGEDKAPTHITKTYGLVTL